MEPQTPGEKNGHLKCQGRRLKLYIKVLFIYIPEEFVLNFHQVA